MNRVRPATVIDAAAIARIDAECWRSTYAGVLPDKLLLGLSESERKRVWSSYIARHPGDLVVGITPAGRAPGFGNCGRRPDAQSPLAREAFTPYAPPDYHGQ